MKETRRAGQKIAMYYATAREMEKLDALAVERGLEIRQMMELAGWRMLALFERLGVSHSAKVAVVVGKGNKGGDGLSAARHLANYGWNVSVILLSNTLSAEAAHQARLVAAMGISLVRYEERASEARALLSESDVVIDALIGYRLEGPPRDAFGEVIEAMNISGKTILAYDVPSGVDPTSGECLSPCVRAEATLSLALPKRGYLSKESASEWGRVFVGDIGIPGFLYDAISIGSRPHFEDDGLLQLE